LTNYCAPRFTGVLGLDFRRAEAIPPQPRMRAKPMECAMAKTGLSIHRLGADDAAVMQAVLDLFAAAFGDIESYSSRRPSPA
jgi:hypothetical protein